MLGLLPSTSWTLENGILMWICDYLLSKHWKALFLNILNFKTYERAKNQLRGEDGKDSTITLSAYWTNMYGNL